MSEGQSLLSSAAGSVASIALVLAVLGLVCVVILLARQQRLLGQYQQLMTGTSGGNLERILSDHMLEVRRTAARVEEIGQLVQRLEQAAGFNLQYVGLVRFNPFPNTGGDQSFALAMVDDRGGGVVLSSLHAREVTRMYAKPLDGWRSPHMLTDEEKQAIDLAHARQS